jgi:hypothetical protein
MKMSAEVVLRFVSPAVFCADHEYINGAALRQSRSVSRARSLILTDTSKGT